MNRSSWAHSSRRVRPTRGRRVWGAVWWCCSPCRTPPARPRAAPAGARCWAWSTRTRPPCSAPGCGWWTGTSRWPCTRSETSTCRSCPLDSRGFGRTWRESSVARGPVFRSDSRRKLFLAVGLPWSLGRPWFPSVPGSLGIPGLLCPLPYQEGHILLFGPFFHEYPWVLQALPDLSDLWRKQSIVVWIGVE